VKFSVLKKAFYNVLSFSSFEVNYFFNKNRNFFTMFESKLKIKNIYNKPSQNLTLKYL